MTELPGQAPPSSADQPVGPPGTFPGFSGPHAPHESDLYRCVHCGFCLQACPTYLETGLEAESPRGRIALMKAVNEGRLDMTPAVIGHWDMCLKWGSNPRGQSAQQILSLPP